MTIIIFTIKMEPVCIGWFQFLIVFDGANFFFVSKRGDSHVCLFIAFKQKMPVQNGYEILRSISVLIRRTSHKIAIAFINCSMFMESQGVLGKFHLYGSVHVNPSKLHSTRSVCLHLNFITFSVFHAYILNTLIFRAPHFTLNQRYANWISS